MTGTLGALIGSGKEAEIYLYDPGWVVKLTRWRKDHEPARREDAILRALAPSGLVPASRGIAEIGERWGVVIEHVEGSVLADSLRAPDGVAGVLAAMLALHRQIHETIAPSGLPKLKDRLARNIERAPYLDGADRERLLAMLAALPDGDRLCHGDFHPYNVIVTDSSARAIDWLDASAGDPAADVCRTFLLIGTVEPALAETYVERYCAAAGLDRMAVYAWLPVLAAARLAEKVPDETKRLLALARGNAPR